MQEEVKHYKVKSLPTILRPNSVYYVKATSQSAVKTYITDQIGFAFPLIDLNSAVQTVTGTGVTGTASNPIVDISTFKSSQLGNLIELSTNDGKLFVKPIISPDGSIDIVSTATSLELQLGTSLQTQIQNALQPGDNISELVNDVGYITLADIPFSAVSATAWTPNHTAATGNPYLAGTIVYYQGHIFQANFNNDSIVPVIGGNLYWTDLGVGYLIDQEQTDWLAVSGSAFIKNKPTNVSSFINDAGYLTSFTETDPVFSAWLSTNPLSSYATQSWVGNNFYPLNSNPSGYLTQEEVEEYNSLSSFPVVGTLGVVYIALDTGLFYSWNGSTYVLSSYPNTGITGGGIINRLPKFTPNGTTLGSSNFSDTGFEGRYSLSATNFVSFYPTGNIWIRLQRSLGNHMDFILGNAGISQTASLTANNTYGVEIVASAATAFLELKAGGFEGLRVLPTGQLRFTQTPNAGTTSDSVLVRDSSGNIKIVSYPTIPSLSELHNVNITSPQNHDVLMYNNTVWENKNPFDYFDAKPIIYQKHVNMPVWGSTAVNNVEGVAFGAGNTARTWADTNIVTRTQRQGIITSTTGNAAQIRQTITYLSQIDGFNVVSGFNMAENATDTTIRFFIGLSTTTLFSNVEPNTLLNCIGFCRLSTSNNIHLVHNDNAGIGTTLDLGSNFPANTISTDKYLVYWKTVSTGIYIKIERVGTAFTYETIVTSDIPSTTTALNFGAYIVDTSGASVSTGFDWYGTHIQV